ncbi:hypothetical protein Goklo_000866 [Gossypium klotzschianum]|uniref:Uncharacterized protein n=1 Tax=Gossypium klotzschianum TaxID=34286 RepID=A0A7J8VZJ2_9ROSI|nr:hypothetical protein [Gossypium klotzschianum]
MEKPIPKVGSHKNGCSSARKSTSRIPKGVIQVQASFNNTIVILTDVWGWVISWSSIDTCGFNGIRKGTPCASQTEVGNAIRAVVDQGIQESVHEILMNLKEIVLSGNLYGPRNAFICAKGPGYVTDQDIILPPSVEIVDNTQHVTTLIEPIYLCIGLQIEKNRVYDIKMPKKFKTEVL